MLFPIADDNRERRTTPVVNYVLILINIFVFVFLQGLGSNEKFTYAYSTVPGEIITGRDIVTRPVAVQNFTGQRMEMPGLQPTPIPVWLTLITSMFMQDRKSTRLNSSHLVISYAVFCLKKKKNTYTSLYSNKYDSSRSKDNALFSGLIRLRPMIASNT